MKTLVITNLYHPFELGGYEQRCYEVVNSLEKQGHDILVITSTYGVDEKSKDGNIWRVLHFHWFKPIHSIPKLLISEALDQYHLRNALAKFTPDIIYVWSGRALTKSFLTIINECGCPVVFDISDNWLFEIENDRWLRFWKGVSPSVMKRWLKFIVSNLISKYLVLKVEKPTLDHAYFTSFDIKQQYIDAGFDVKHSPVIYPGIPLSIYRYSPGPRLKHQNPVRILFVGRISRAKGVLVLLEAVNFLVTKSKFLVHLTLIGKSGIEPEFEFELDTYIVNHNLQAYITRVEQLPREKLALLYSSHDIIVFPSIGKESFGKVPLEAMASGKPVISSAPGGTMEFLQDGFNSLLFEPGNSQQLATQIEKLYFDDELKSQIVENAHSFVHKNFNTSRMIFEISRYLQSIYNHKNSPL